MSSKSYISNFLIFRKMYHGQNWVFEGFIVLQFKTLCGIHRFSIYFPWFSIFGVLRVGFWHGECMVKKGLLVSLVLSLMLIAFCVYLLYSSFLP
jgi:hypothetical protein